MLLLNWAFTNGADSVESSTDIFLSFWKQSYFIVTLKRNYYQWSKGKV